MRVAIFTISDSAFSGKRPDASGPAVRERCAQLGWTVVAEQTLPDEPAAICEHLMEVADSATVELILTTGGTGIGPRDLTPEATMQACQKLLPGISEMMREYGRKKTPRAALSRAVAGVRDRVLIVNLPGSPRGAMDSLDAVGELLPHAIEVLHGARHDKPLAALNVNASNLTGWQKKLSFGNPKDGSMLFRPRNVLKRGK